jgi:mRNA interferase RelE/StbE
MNVEFDKSFLKSLKRINDKNILSRIEKAIISLENAPTLENISGLKKLSGYTAYYRLRIGDYRFGFEKISNQTIRLIIILHRKDIYKIFP